jgi:hypothetical protein
MDGKGEGRRAYRFIHNQMIRGSQWMGAPVGDESHGPQ